MATTFDTTKQLFEKKITLNEKLLTKKEIASFLNVSIKMIDRKVSMNEIPYLKIGKLVRFDKETVLGWAKENTPSRR
jgi:excisionase family DNA binding protein